MLKINQTLETMNIRMPHIDNWKKWPKLCIKFNGFLCVEIQYQKTIVINQLKANVEFFLINMLWRNYYRRYEWFVYELWRWWFLPFQWHKKFIEKLTYLRNSHAEMFLGRDILKICSKFTGEHPCRSAVALQLYWNRTSAWVFSCKFAAYFQNTFS